MTDRCCPDPVLVLSGTQVRRSGKLGEHLRVDRRSQRCGNAVAKRCHSAVNRAVPDFQIFRAILMTVVPEVLLLGTDADQPVSDPQPHARGLRRDMRHPVQCAQGFPVRGAVFPFEFVTA